MFFAVFFSSIPTAPLGEPTGPVQPCSVGNPQLVVVVVDRHLDEDILNICNTCEQDKCTNTDGRPRREQLGNSHTVQ